MTITEFILARVEEDEAAAWGTSASGYRTGPVGPSIGVTVGGARLRAECEAKRRIVGMHYPAGSYLTRADDGPREEHYCAECGSGEPYEYPAPWPCATLQFLALPYASHPDYQPEWKVEQ